MAYDYFEEQDDKNGQSPAGQPASGMVEQQLGPESATQPGDAKAGNAGAGGGTSSGSYTNLQSYLDANKSQNFGSQLAGRVQGSVDKANEAQGTASTGFKSNVDQNTIGTNQGLLDETKSNPVGITGDAQKFSDFLRMRDANYGGPNNFAEDANDYQAANKATSQAQEQADASKTEGGRKSLLDVNYGGGAGRYDYTGGQKNLDNLLVQNDPTSREAFAKTQNNAAQSQANLGSLSEELGNYAGQGKQTTANTKSATRQALGIDDSGQLVKDANGNPVATGAIGSTYGGLQSNAAAQQARYDKITSDVQKAVAAKDVSGLTDEEKQMLGVPEFQGPFYGVDPSSSTYLSMANRGDINSSSAASKEDAAKMDALSQLAGMQNTLTDSSKAGTAPSDYVDFNKEGFQAGVSSAKADYLGKETNLNQQIQQLVNSPIPVTGAGNPTKERHDAIQQKYDELNQVRQRYELPPIANPYANGIPSSTQNPVPKGALL